MDRLAAMEAFVQVVEAGSFSAAARLLGVGQPAVSKTVAQLEERLGVQLLLRSSRRLTPTEAGQTYYEHARRSIEAADEADLAARDINSGLTGRLRFSAAVTFARLQIVPHLGDFLADHPALAVEAVLDDRNVDLVEEGIDVALRMGNLTDSTLVGRRLGALRRVVVATPAYLAAHGEPRLPAELPNHPAIVYALAGGGGNWTFTRKEVIGNSALDGKGISSGKQRGAAQRRGTLGTSVSVTLQDRLRFTAAEGMREAVFAGLGLAVSSEGMFEPELSQGKVKALLTDWQLPPLDLWAIFPAGRRASVKARRFVDFVEARLRRSGILRD
ncbi:MAG TPA: LysR family transcriptional regulator [Terriglobia bacterium]|nr:LysR family transcriptional regulator [Terriglobia bacterium]